MDQTGEIAIIKDKKDKMEIAIIKDTKDEAEKIVKIKKCDKITTKLKKNKIIIDNIVIQSNQ